MLQAPNSHKCMCGSICWIAKGAPLRTENGEGAAVARPDRLPQQRMTPVLCPHAAVIIPHVALPAPELQQDSVFALAGQTRLTSLSSSAKQDSNGPGGGEDTQAHSINSTSKWVLAFQLY